MNSISGISMMMAERYGIQPRQRVTGTAEQAVSRPTAVDPRAPERTELPAAAQAAARPQATAQQTAQPVQPAEAGAGSQPTQQRFSDALQKLAEQLDQQRVSRRMEDALASSGLVMPARPGDTRQDGTGTMPSPISAAGQPATPLSNAVQQVESADSNQNGQVSTQEASVYQRAQESAAAVQAGSAAAVNGGTAVTAPDVSPEQVSKQVEKLFKAYVAQYYSSGSASGNPISVAA